MDIYTSGQTNWKKYRVAACYMEEINVNETPQMFGFSLCYVAADVVMLSLPWNK